MDKFDLISKEFSKVWYDKLKQICLILKELDIKDIPENILKDNQRILDIIEVIENNTWLKKVNFKKIEKKLKEKGLDSIFLCSKIDILKNIISTELERNLSQKNKEKIEEEISTISDLLKNEKSISLDKESIKEVIIERKKLEEKIKKIKLLEKELDLIEKLEKDYFDKVQENSNQDKKEEDLNQDEKEKYDKFLTELDDVFNKVKELEKEFEELIKTPDPTKKQEKDKFNLLCHNYISKLDILSNRIDRLETKFTQFETKLTIKKEKLEKISLWHDNYKSIRDSILKKIEENLSQDRKQEDDYYKSFNSLKLDDIENHYKKCLWDNNLCFFYNFLDNNFSKINVLDQLNIVKFLLDNWENKEELKRKYFKKIKIDPLKDNEFYLREEINKQLILYSNKTTILDEEKLYIIEIDKIQEYIKEKDYISLIWYLSNNRYLKYSNIENFIEFSNQFTKEDLENIFDIFKYHNVYTRIFKIFLKVCLDKKYYSILTKRLFYYKNTVFLEQIIFKIFEYNIHINKEDLKIIHNYIYSHIPKNQKNYNNLIGTYKKNLANAYKKYMESLKNLEKTKQEEVKDIAGKKLNLKKNIIMDH